MMKKDDGNDDDDVGRDQIAFYVSFCHLPLAVIFITKNMRKREISLN